MSSRPGVSASAFWGDGDDELARQRFRTLLGAIDDGIYQLDESGEFVGVNDAIVETTGYSREELLGEHVSLLLFADDADRIQRAIADRVRAGTTDSLAFELGVRTADGATATCELRISPLVVDGEFRGTVGVARDVVETDADVETLPSARAAADPVPEVLDEANVGVVVLDEDAIVAWADETVGEYFGLNRRELIGRDGRRVVDQFCERVAAPDHFADRVRSTYDGDGSVERFDFRILADDGHEERRLEHYSSPIESGRYAGGRIELYYDVTDRPRSTDDLRETEERFQSLVDAVEEYAIFRLDTDGTVVSWNEGAKAIKGYDAEDILGEHFSTFYTEADRAAGVPGRNLAEATESGSVEDEGWRVREDGSEFWATVTITAVFDDDGTHRGFLKVTRDMTDRRRYERELESELRRVLGRISDAFYAVDEDLRFTHVNERTEALLQRTEVELLGEVVWDVLPSAADDDEVREAFETAMECQEPTSYETYYETLDFWAEANLYPSETGISVYFRDVTQRRARQEQLEERERVLEQYREYTDDVLDAIDDVFYILGSDGQLVRWNESICSVTGYADAEVGDMHATEFFDDEDVPTIANAVAEGFETGGVQVDASIRTKAGASIPYEFVASTLTDPDGERVLAGIGRDVSDRAARERELERRARQQQVVADLGQIALESDDLDELMAEATERVASVLDNEYAKVLDLDASHRELLLRQGVGWDEGVVGEASVDADENSQAGYTLLSDGPVIVDDLATETRFSGPELLESHDVASGISTIIGSIDDPWGILGTHDTERQSFAREDVNFVQSVANVLAEAIERERYQRELEALVADFQESNERLEQFAYAASHDLQEPLRMVSSYLQLIERRYADELDADGEEFLAFAVDGADRMREMIDGLLQYSRVETQGDPFEPVDLNEVVDVVLDDVQVRIDETDADVDVGSLPRVTGDPSQLRQVFQNLLSNAVEYSGDEPPRIRVDAERECGEWVVSVTDHGVGLDPDDADRIFEVFQRLHTHDEHPGTGIGLALCQRIVERHGGEIWVESTPGEGATFSFTLPDSSA